MKAQVTLIHTEGQPPACTVEADMGATVRVVYEKTAGNLREQVEWTVEPSKPQVEITGEPIKWSEPVVGYKEDAEALFNRAYVYLARVDREAPMSINKHQHDDIRITGMKFTKAEIVERARAFGMDRTPPFADDYSLREA